MIPRTPPSCQSNTGAKSAKTAGWQKQQAEAFRNVADLLAFLQLPPQLLDGARQASTDFTLRVPRSYAALMEKGNAADPLLRQVLPIEDETLPQDGYLSDPVGDLAALAVPGLLHKYRGRVLLLTTAACGIHCRYCFRRHFPYSQHRAEAHWQQTINYIQQNEDIHEVILSGGDPLTLTESRLREITEALRPLSHIHTLRIHSRQPVVLPARIDTPFLHWLQTLPWKIVLVIHANHANEISPAVIEAMQRLQQQGVTLLNQSVLLKGVNDNADTLTQLSEKLFTAGVLPYYLHLLDKVAGAAHFHVNEDRARALIEKLRARLPGYLVPRLVTEIAGKSSKTAIL